MRHIKPLAVQGTVLDELPGCLQTGTLDVTKPLARALFTGDVPIFDEAAVEKYKEEQIAKHPPGFFWRHQILAFFLSHFVMPILALVATAWLDTQFEFSKFTLIGVLSLLFGTGWLLITVTKKPARWTATGYDDAPMEVLALARELESIEIPGGVTRIYAFTLKQGWAVLDPFLVIETRFNDESGREDECYHVAVWDEPDFGGSHTI